MRKGFTFLELTIVIAIIAILSAATIALINPPKLYARAHNTQRWSNLNTILNAIGENAADNKGTFTCAAGTIPSSTIKMATSTYNIAPCLVPSYLPSLPYDPTASGAHYSSTTDYDTGYTAVRNATSGRVTLSAPSAELGEVISVTR